MKRISGTGLLAAALLSATCAAAAAPVPTAELTATERLDRNRAYQAAAPDPDQDSDGRISFREWHDKEWRFLLSYDTDGDQRLSMAEYIAVFCISPKEVHHDSAYTACETTKRGDFGAAGRAPDFAITRDVYRSVARRTFRYNDKDGDGYLRPSRETYAEGLRP